MLRTVMYATSGWGKRKMKSQEEVRVPSGQKMQQGGKSAAEARRLESTTPAVGGNAGAQRKQGQEQRCVVEI